jgi:hypothetical protein
MPELRELESYKNEIKKHFDNYICWWKLSVFHHHNARAIAVLAALMSSQDIQQIKHILFNQRGLFCHEAEVPVNPEEYDPYIEIDNTILDRRWSSQLNHKCSKSHLNHSGYFNTLASCLSIFKKPENTVIEMEYIQHNNNKIIRG